MTQCRRKPHPFVIFTCEDDPCAALCPSSPVRPLSKEITMSQAYQNMCAGMYKVYIPPPLSHHTQARDMKNHMKWTKFSLCVSFCVQTMVALDMDGKVRKPSFELDSEQVRYEHRFAPFNSVVTPPPVHYIQFKVVLFTVSCMHMN